MLTVGKRYFGCCECDKTHSIKYVASSSHAKFCFFSKQNHSDCKYHANRLTPEETSNSQARPVLDSVLENSVFDDSSCEEDDRSAYNGIIVRDFATEHFSHNSNATTNAATTSIGAHGTTISHVLNSKVGDDQDQIAIYSDSEDGNDNEQSGRNHRGSSGQKNDGNDAGEGNKPVSDEVNDEKDDKKRRSSGNFHDMGCGGDSACDAPDKDQTDEKTADRDDADNYKIAGGDDAEKDKGKAAIASNVETGQQGIAGPSYVDQRPDWPLEHPVLERYFDSMTGMERMTIEVDIPEEEPMMFKMDEEYEEAVRQKEAREKKAREAKQKS